MVQPAENSPRSYPAIAWQLVAMDAWAAVFTFSVVETQVDVIFLSNHVPHSHSTTRKQVVGIELSDRRGYLVDSEKYCQPESFRQFQSAHRFGAMRPFRIRTSMKDPPECVGMRYTLTQAAVDLKV
jgi:hypothetical protein